MKSVSRARCSRWPISCSNRGLPGLVLGSGIAGALIALFPVGTAVAVALMRKFTGNRCTTAVRSRRSSRSVWWVCSSSPGC